MINLNVWYSTHYKKDLNYCINCYFVWGFVAHFHKGYCQYSGSGGPVFSTMLCHPSLLGLNSMITRHFHNVGCNLFPFLNDYSSYFKPTGRPFKKNHNTDWFQPKSCKWNREWVSCVFPGIQVGCSSSSAIQLGNCIRQRMVPKTKNMWFQC